MSEATVMMDALSPLERVGTHPRRRHVGLLVLASLSLVVTMSLTQLGTFERGSLQYWLLVTPTALLPMLDIGPILGTFLGRARLLLYFVVSAGLWQLLAGDYAAVLQLGLLVLVLTWLSSARAKFNVRDLAWLYVALVLLGIIVHSVTELSVYGLVPGTSQEEFGIWRVSFFPNIAYTGIVSLALVLILTKTWVVARTHALVLTLALYFLIFSFVRAAFVGAVIYAVLYWWFQRRASSPRSMFWISLLAALGINLMIAFSAAVVVNLQQLPLVSQLLLRGESGLSADEIFDQIYRPWLWWQHLTLFASSPHLMGWGSFDFFDMTVEKMAPHLISAGSEALPTRLLATYGLPGLLFTAYLIVRLRNAARERDAWSCACFPAVFMLLMNWGSVFHPSDAVFALCMLMIVRGSRGFVWR